MVQDSEPLRDIYGNVVPITVGDNGDVMLGPFSPVAAHDFQPHQRPPSRHSRWISNSSEGHIGVVRRSRRVEFGFSMQPPVVIEPRDSDADSDDGSDHGPTAHFNDDSIPDSSENLNTGVVSGDNDAVMSALRDAMVNVRRNVRRLQMQQLVRRQTMAAAQQRGARRPLSAFENRLSTDVAETEPSNRWVDDLARQTNRDWRVHNGRLSMVGMETSMDTNSSNDTSDSIRERWLQLERVYREYMLERGVDSNPRDPAHAIGDESANEITQLISSFQTDVSREMSQSRRRASLHRMLSNEADFWTELETEIQSTHRGDDKNVDDEQSGGMESLSDLIMRRSLDRNGCSRQADSSSLGRVYDSTNTDFEFVGR